MYGVSDSVIRFIKLRVQDDKLAKVRIDKIEALSKKLAYQYCQAHRGNDYRNIQKDILTALRRLRNRPEYYKYKASSMDSL